MKPARILFVASSLPVGGAERQIQTLAENLAPDRFVSTFCCAKAPGVIGEELMAAGFTVHSRLIRRRYDLSLIFKLRRLIEREAIDLVYARDELNVIVCGALAAALSGIPVVISEHSTIRPHRRRRIALVRRLLLPVIDRVIAVAEAHKEYLVRYEGLDPGKIQVIYNGVDPDRFEVVPSTSLREELDMPRHAPTAGIVAVLRPEKAHDVFLEAAYLVNQALPSTYFLIVGDGPERERLERLADGLGMGSRVRFCGHRSDIPQILAELDVVVLSSDARRETFPMALLEAMAAGKPVVATRVGSIPEMVLDGITGYLVPLRSPADLAVRLRRLLEDAELRARMGARGRERVKRRFIAERMVRETEGLIEDVIRSRTKKGRLLSSRWVRRMGRR